METVTNINRMFAWQYDSLYRLTNETFNLSSNLFYTYDSVGNRLGRTNGAVVVGSLTNQAFAYGTNDWLLRDQYDSDGNTTNSPLGFSQYSVMDQLVTNGSISIVYDGGGNRVSKTVGGLTTYYLVDDRNPSGYAQVLEEWTVSGGSNNLAKVYNYGLGLISQRQVSGGKVSYYGYDGHGSVRFLISTNGAITDTYTYDAFGTLIASTGTTPKNYLYCCQQYDPDLGLYDNRARYLNPNTGRFWSSDQTDGDNEDPLSLHKYLYCQGNPVNLTDPSGHDPDVASLEASTFLVAGLAAFGGAALYEAKTHAIGNLLVSYYATEATTTIASEMTTTQLERPKSTQEVKTKIQDLTENDPGSKIFYHGASTATFSDYSSAAIEFNKGSGSLGRGFYTTSDPNGLKEAAPSAYDAPGGGIPIILVFTIKMVDFSELRGEGPLQQWSIPPDQFSPGFDYLYGPYGTSQQFNWQPGSRGSVLLVAGFKGVVPLPTRSDWTTP
jgi:RHS repeat-associated protein